MAGVNKARNKQVPFNAKSRGKTGKGNGLSSLIRAEGLVIREPKRIALIDTERADFFCVEIPERAARGKSHSQQRRQRRSHGSI